MTTENGHNPITGEVLMVADQSPTLGKLGEALAKAQGSMSAAKKDRVNPHFKSSYADLASIWEAIRKPLSENGLAVVQQTTSERGGVTVVSTLLHSSGEFIRDRCWMPVAQQTPQGYGSALTYARRYSLAAIVGVAAEEDDDGNTASSRGNGNGSMPRTAAEMKAQVAAKLSAKSQTKPTPSQAMKMAGAITNSEVSRIPPAPVANAWERIKAAGLAAHMSPDAITAKALELGGKTKRADLTSEDADKFCAWVEDALDSIPLPSDSGAPPVEESAPF